MNAAEDDLNAFDRGHPSERRQPRTRSRRRRRRSRHKFGTDVAMESAGVTLLNGDLTGIVRARTLSQVTMSNIR